MILDWLENLPKEDRPPQWMWHLDEKLIEWFEEVDRKREARFGSNGGREMPEMEQSELTKGLRR